MKTYSAKTEDIERQWVVIDARDQVLGRLATRVASVLRGKHKPMFSTHLDVGDFVVDGALHVAHPARFERHHEVGIEGRSAGAACENGHQCCSNDSIPHRFVYRFEWPVGKGFLVSPRYD